MSRPHDHAEYQRNRPVVLREQPTCTVCNRQPSTQVDHIIPVDAGGGHEMSNLRGVCFKCNNILGHRYVSQRNEIRRTIRAEAMREHGVIDTEQKRFFTQTKLVP
ncbi:MAG: HNH endonuclease signature motif containing protein, partial [Weissella cibaria]